jgi:hypothetical protein
MKVVSYKNVVPAKNKSKEKIDVLEKFIIGVNKHGDTGLTHNQYSLVDCDLAVIQGWQHEKGKSSPHLKLRQNVIDRQIKTNKFVCVADSNLFLYANKSNIPHHYLRYSLNGIFPNSGIYFDDNPDPKRWQNISKDLDIQLESYKRTGSNIILCLQRSGGWSMGKMSVYDWVIQTVSKIRRHSDRKIVLRPHPGDKKAESSYLQELRLFYDKEKNIEFSTMGKPFEDDLKNAWAVVNHNSSSIVGPIVKGYYAFVTDWQKSQCYDVANYDLSQIENPREFDRQKWLERISMFHWKFSELEDGTAWAHIRNYVRQ